MRKDAYDDFHFMKLVGAEWRHKPGESQILKYNYIPSNDRDWTNEGLIEGEVVGGFGTYTDTIYYSSATKSSTTNSAVSLLFALSGKLLLEKSPGCANEEVIPNA